MDESTPEVNKDDNCLKSSEYVISRSTGRRYNEVVQEFLKQKLGKSEPQLSNNSIPPSQILTAHSDKAGPEEGSYVSWECPDTPGTKRPISIPDGNEDLDNTPGSHTKPKAKPSSSSSKYFSSVSGMDSFRTADPFSPLAKNVVRLSDSSMQSPWNDSNPFSSGSRGSKSSSKHGGLDEISSGSPASRPGSDVITVFPKNSVFPSPDRSMHGPPLTTFTCADDANDSFTSIPIQTPTPKEDHDFSKGKCPPVNPHTPSIRLTSVKGSSLSLFDGSLIKESTTPSKQQPTLAPVIDQSDLLSPSLGPLTEMTKSRHPLGKEGYGQESPDSLEFSVSSVESRKSEGKSLGACSHASQITPSDHSQDESSKPNQSEDLRSFYTPDTTSVHPRALDFENTSGRSESLKKFRTPQDDSIASYPPEEMDVKTYTINISTPPRSAASSRSSVHRREIPLWQVSDDMDLYQNEITRRKNIRRRLRCGWCLIVFGTLLLITCIIAILAIEIPAHREEVSKVIPNSQALVNSDDGFEDLILTTDSEFPVNSPYSVLPDVVVIQGRDGTIGSMSSSTVTDLPRSYSLVVEDKSKASIEGIYPEVITAETFHLTPLNTTATISFGDSSILEASQNDKSLYFDENGLLSLTLTSSDSNISEPLFTATTETFLYSIINESGEDFMTTDMIIGLMHPFEAGIASATHASDSFKSIPNGPTSHVDAGNPQNVVGAIKNMTSKGSPVQNQLSLSENTPPHHQDDEDFLTARPNWLENYELMRS